MGRFKFSSWTLHMASIMIFSTLWGIALQEWTGTSRHTKNLVALTLVVLIASTVIIGYGNSLATAVTATDRLMSSALPIARAKLARPVLEHLIRSECAEERHTMIENSFLSFRQGASTGGMSLLCLAGWLAPLCCWASAPDKRPQADGSASPAELRSSTVPTPWGSTSSEPRLSWIVASAERGQRQTAYQVLVASGEATLKLDQGDLWDSGQVESDETTAVVYGANRSSRTSAATGRSRSGTRMASPRPGAPRHSGPWACSSPSDWKAEWIGYDKPRDAALPMQGRSCEARPSPPSYLRTTFQVSKPVKPRHALHHRAGDS